MSSFSYQNQYHPILHDSVFMAKNNISGLLLSDNNNNNTNSCLLSQMYSSGNNYDDNIMIINNNTKSCGGEEEKRQSNTDSYSTIVDNKLESSGDDEQVTQKLVASLDKKRKSRIGSSSIISNNNSQLLSKEGRGNKKRKNVTLTTTTTTTTTSSSEKEEKKVNNNNKKNEETKKKNNTNNINNNEEPPSGYIHVRARRGQATDSHSLAERVRREKISERMKMLQRLVPGCEKVTGKALMLDEIINYVQSLQNQVEFLSMKLASLNPMFYDFGMDIDTLMVRPEGLLMASQIPAMPQCVTHENNNNINSNNNYQTQTLIENSPSLLVQQQGQRPNVFSHDNVSLLWDMEDQRQSFLNPSGFISNLCSFN